MVIASITKNVGEIVFGFKHIETTGKTVNGVFKRILLPPHITRCLYGTINACRHTHSLNEKATFIQLVFHVIIANLSKKITPSKLSADLLARLSLEKYAYTVEDNTALEFYLYQTSAYVKRLLKNHSETGKQAIISSISADIKNSRFVLNIVQSNKQ